MKRCLIFFLLLNLLLIIPVRAVPLSPFITSTEGVVFVRMADSFPANTIMNLGESRVFSIRVARLHAAPGSVHTGRWFRDGIPIGDEFNIHIPPSGSFDVPLNIINAAIFHSGFYTLRVTTTYNNIVTHTDPSPIGMNLFVLSPGIPQLPTPEPPQIVPDAPSLIGLLHVGSQWGAPVSNMVSFPVSTTGISNGFYRISLSGLPLHVIAPTHARIHHNVFNPQLQISNIWAATPGDYLLTLTIYDALGNPIAVSSPFMLTIFDHWR